MKKILIITIFCFQSFFGQQNSNGDEDVMLFNDGDGVITMGHVKRLPSNVIEGNVYLFETWKKSLLYSSDKKKYLLRKTKYNIKTGNFEVKMPNDSILEVNPLNVDAVEMESKVFKKIEFNNEVKFYEIIKDGGKISFFKNYKIRLIKGKMNPLNGIKEPDKYYKQFDYFIVSDSKKEVIKLKEKNIIPFFVGKQKQMKLLVQKEKLSYKKENDVIKMLKYFDLIQ